MRKAKCRESLDQPWTCPHSRLTRGAGLASLSPSPPTPPRSGQKCVPAADAYIENKKVLRFVYTDRQPKVVSRKQLSGREGEAQGGVLWLGKAEAGSPECWGLPPCPQAAIQAWREEPGRLRAQLGAGAPGGGARRGPRLSPRPPFGAAASWDPLLPLREAGLGPVPGPALPRSPPPRRSGPALPP